MSKSSLLLAAVALCGLAAPVRADPTINNGDFETGADMFMTFPGYLGMGTNPSEIPGWDSHSGGGVGVVPGSQTGDPDGACRDNGDNGTNVAFLQGVASLTQTISGFTVGNTYQLDFDYNSRAGCCPGPPNTPTPTLTVTLGMGSVTEQNVVAVDPPTVHVTAWYHDSFTFVADSETLDLVISSTVDGDGTSLIDNLVLTSTGAPP